MEEVEGCLWGGEMSGAGRLNFNACQCGEGESKPLGLAAKPH